MKNSIILAIVFFFLTFSHCLKAKRSPFDVSKPSPSLMGVIANILGRGQNANSGSTLPSVTSTSPADSATGVIANTSVQITFNMAMDKTSITTNTDDTTCSGTVQISFDNFSTCVKMRSSITTTDNKTFTLSANPTMGTFATHKIRVTTGAMNETKTKLEKDFSHSTGFTTSTPCTVYDATTCPIPFSTAVILKNSMNVGGLVIPIESGTAKGNIFIVIGGATPTTNLFTPSNGVISTGPNLTGNHGWSSGESVGTAFTISSGTNAGKIMIVHGYLSSTTSIYDPVANTMQAGPNLTSAAINWLQSFPITTGANIGKTVILSNSPTTNIYDPSINSFTVGPNLTPSTPALGAGNHNITISTGANAGKTLIVYAGGNTTTSIYDPSSNSFSAGPNMTPLPFYGSNSFIIPSGSQSGNILIARGNTSTDTFIYNSTNSTISGGPVLPSLIDIGSGVGTHSIAISSGINQGKVWLIHGTGSLSLPSNSSFYDPSANTFSSGPAMITQATLNAKTVFIETGIHANKYMTFYGANAKFTSLYDPTKNALDASSVLPTSAGNGVNKVLLTTGSNSGKMLIINGGGNTSSLFDFASGTFSAGPNLTGSMGRSPGIVTLSSGSNSGKTLVIHGGNTTSTSLYDPTANTFSAGPTLSAAADSITSDCIYNIPSGTQAGKYLIIHGNTSTSSTLYDPSNNTMAAGPGLGSVVGLGATCFPVTSGANSGKFIVIQGSLSGTGTRIYDPSTNTFTGGPALANNATSGTLAIPITVGTNANKVLILIGTGTTTNLYDPTTHTFSAGPSLSSSASSGSYLLLSVGSNKNKYLIVHGTTTSIYDPNTNGISAGPSAPDGGILGFNVASGLFNQGVLLIVGGSGNLTSVIYP